MSIYCRGTARRFTRMPVETLVKCCTTERSRSDVIFRCLSQYLWLYLV